MTNSPLVVNIAVTITDSYQNRTFSLLGLYDDDPTNDFRAQNGSIITLDDSFALEEIHQFFGTTWAINPDVSTNQTNSTYEICNIDPSSTNQSTWTFSQRT
jgi:hypothetical protein